MFLVSHSLSERAAQIRSWIPKHPSIALVVAAVYFEWTLCRAIVGLSKRPNKDVRAGLEKAYGIDRYKDFWKAETSHVATPKTLPQLVKNWHAVTQAFDARNLLVHGRDRYTQNMVRSLIDALLSGVTDICEFCLTNGVDINKRLPQRRQKRKPTPP
jgi:hypothetical protein